MPFPPFDDEYNFVSCDPDNALWDLALPLQPLQLSAKGQLRLVGPHHLTDVFLEGSLAGRGLGVLLDPPSFPKVGRLRATIWGCEEVMPAALQPVAEAVGALVNLTTLDLNVHTGLSYQHHQHLLRQLCKLQNLAELLLYLE